MREPVRLALDSRPRAHGLACDSRLRAIRVCAPKRSLEEWTYGTTYGTIRKQLLASASKSIMLVKSPLRFQPFPPVTLSGESPSNSAEAQPRRGAMLIGRCHRANREPRHPVLR